MHLGKMSECERNMAPHSGLLRAIYVIYLLLWLAKASVLINVLIFH